MPGRSPLVTVALRRVVLGVLFLFLIGCAGVAAASVAEDTPCNFGETNCGGGGSNSGDTTTLSDGTQQQTYRAPSKVCSVYANGGGMGMSCVTVGGAGGSKSLHERFGDQKLQRCRYSEIPGVDPGAGECATGRGPVHVDDLLGELRLRPVPMLVIVTDRDS